MVMVWRALYVSTNGCAGEICPGGWWCCTFARYLCIWLMHVQWARRVSAAIASIQFDFRVWKSRPRQSVH